MRIGLARGVVATMEAEPQLWQINETTSEKIKIKIKNRCQTRPCKVESRSRRATRRYATAGADMELTRDAAPFVQDGFLGFRSSARGCPAESASQKALQDFAGAKRRPERRGDEPADRVAPETQKPHAREA